jgi:hypothetical protein
VISRISYTLQVLFSPCGAKKEPAKEGKYHDYSLLGLGALLSNACL